MRSTSTLLPTAGKAVGFAPAKVGAGGKTRAFIVKQNVCVQIFTCFGLTLVMLFLLLQSADTDLRHTVAEIEAQSTISVNEERMQRLSGTEDALEAEAFQHQNMDFVRNIRSQNGRMFVLLNHFMADINATINSEVTDTAVQTKLHNSIMDFNKKLRYRLRDVQHTLQADTHATKSRLGHVNTRIKKLLKKKTPKHLTKKQKKLRRQKQLRAWKKPSKTPKLPGSSQRRSASAAGAGRPRPTKPISATDAADVQVKLPSFAEFKKQHQTSTRDSRTSSVHSRGAAGAGGDADAGAAGAKRQQMERQHRAVQAKLQRIFSMAHELPAVRVTAATEDKWKALAEEYRQQLQLDASDKAVSGRLARLSERMAGVLRSPNGRRDLLTMFRSRMFAPTIEPGRRPDARYVEEQTRAHPYRTFRHLLKLLGFTKGKPKVLAVEAQLTAGAIDGFEAMERLRGLMNEKQAPRARPAYQKPVQA